MAEIRNLVKFAALTAVLFLAAFLSAARADDDVKIAGVDGSALLREAGE
ncbi:MAG: hypothetical protein M5R36_24340 [Deltaproteobacteria bacterium]|nr:hypothetical protein [Deltaproteobacteria bacterium]